MIEILKQISTQELLSTYLALEKNISWFIDVNKTKQTGIQYREGEDVFLSAIGKLQKSKSETEYCNINPLFKGTIFEEIINEYKLVRSRLMWIERKTCYSLHKDPSKRIQIPIVTNEQCYFLFPGANLYHLKSGLVYLADTTQNHSFCNFSESPRLHFIGCIYN